MTVYKKQGYSIFYVVIFSLIPLLFIVIPIKTNAAVTDDFTVIIQPDTQGQTENKSGTQLQSLLDAASWVCNEKDNLNIQAFLTVGDLVQKGSIQTEWDNWRSAISIIEGCDLPILSVIGNHDFACNPEGNPSCSPGGIPPNAPLWSVNTQAVMDTPAKSWFMGRSPDITTPCTATSGIGRASWIQFHPNWGAMALPWNGGTDSGGPCESMWSWADTVVAANPNINFIALGHPIVSSGTLNHGDVIGLLGAAPNVISAGGGHWLPKVRFYGQTENINNARRAIFFANFQTSNLSSPYFGGLIIMTVRPTASVDNICYRSYSPYKNEYDLQGVAEVCYNIDLAEAGAVNVAPTTSAGIDTTDTSEDGKIPIIGSCMDKASNTVTSAWAFTSGNLTGEPCENAYFENVGNVSTNIIGASNIAGSCTYELTCSDAEYQSTDSAILTTTNSQKCSWTGAGDGLTWDDDNNWSCGATPDSGLYDVEICNDSASSDTSITTGSELTLGRLTLGEISGGGISCNSKKHSLILNSQLTTIDDYGFNGAGDIVIGANGEIDTNNNTIAIDGDLIIYSAGTYGGVLNASKSTIKLVKDGSISGGGNNFSFWDLELASSTRTTSLDKSITIGNTLTLGGGTLVSTGGQTITLTGTGTPLIVNNSDFSSINFIYDTSSDDYSDTTYIAGGDYGGLVVIDVESKYLLQDDVQTTGNLSMLYGGGLDTNGFDLTVSGETNIGSIYLGGTGELTVSGNSAATFGGDIKAESGSLSRFIITGNNTITVRGNWMTTPGSFDTGTSNVILDNSSDKTIDNSDGFYNLTQSTAADVRNTILTAMTVDGAFNITSGITTLNADLTVEGSYTNTGTLEESGGDLILAIPEPSSSTPSTSPTSSSGGGGGGSSGGGGSVSTTPTNTSTTTSSAITTPTTTSSNIEDQLIKPGEQKQLSTGNGLSADLVNLSGPFYVHGDSAQNRLLQKILSQDTEIYPEGIISGYYGVLTIRAVKNFQRKHNIISSGSIDADGYGYAGPQTREKIKKVYGVSDSGLADATTTQTDTETQTNKTLSEDEREVLVAQIQLLQIELIRLMNQLLLMLSSQ